MSGAAVIAGFGADLVLGDPARWHPVAGFGRLAAVLERVLYAPSRRRGVVHTGLLVGAAALAGRALGHRTRGAALAGLTWAALGGRSLRRESEHVAAALDAGDLDGARAALPALAGRDPEQLGEAEICRAVVESVAENTSDAVVGALFWGAAAGPAGVAAYRAANTLDAMVGHRNERYAEFGWAAARLDDLMSWPGARAGALFTTLCAPVVGSRPGTAWRTLRLDGGAHPSPNAGRMEAAFAGALGLRLGGPLSYGGRLEHRPHLGDGRAPTTADVRRANRLSLAVGATAAVTAALARERLR